MTIINENEFPFRNFINNFDNYEIMPFKKKKIASLSKIYGFGKWYSIKHYWAEWKSEFGEFGEFRRNKDEFKMHKNDHLFDVKLKKNSLTDLQNPSFDKILVLKTHKDLIQFCRKYMTKEPKFRNGEWDMASLNWNKVVIDFGGIEIQVLIRNSKIRTGKYTSWTLEWDCPSGCFWNNELIKEIKRII
jgi:hypothetical protein